MNNLAINRFDTEPGEQLPLASYGHETQEEVFLVLSGTLHVETPGRGFVVSEDSMFAVQPDSLHRAYNPGDAEGAVGRTATTRPSRRYRFPARR
ncbi:cupin domain-containing protein [Natrinema pallidum]|uniref:Cupin n=1 Tax=Natrinema pallidum DSM 3751 TaxID=1227495 RepID=L9Z0S1_9EURY|nr:cupin [Natrinema pallidum DSM 3751]